MRLVLADDSALLREGLAAALAQAGFQIVGQAGDADALLRAVAETRPDVALVDIRMPPTHTDEGIHAAQEIRTRFPDVGVLVLSQHLQTAYAVRVIEDGSERVGYLLKDRVANLGQLTEAILRVGAGDAVIDPEIVRRLLARRRTAGPLEELTERERDVLALMAEGLTNHAIAGRLVISVRTVETHVASIFLKLGLSTAGGDHPRVLAVLTYLRS